MSRPLVPHPFSMTWSDGLFVHWPVDPAALRPHVPAPLELDLYDGDAWVSLLPFVLSRAGLRRSPSFLRFAVPELNCRTYVRWGDAPGLYFFSVDLGSPLLAAVVAGATRLPCYHAEIDVRTRDDRVRFRCVRRHPGQSPARFEVSYGPDGDPFAAEPGTLDHWLAERRRLYDPRGGDGVLTAEVVHGPWWLRPAEATIHANTMFAGNRLPIPDGDARVRYCRQRPMAGSVPRRLHRPPDDRRVPIRPESRP